MAMHHEVTFEAEICGHLAANGWEYSPTDDGYDIKRALYPDDVFAWLESAAPEELAKRVKPSASAQGQARAREAVLDRLVAVLDQPQGGSLKVLRDGFKDTPADFRQMMQKRPEKWDNSAVSARYAANRLRVMRQVRYSAKNGNELDLVLFCNGIPVATVELKTDFTQLQRGQLRIISRSQHATSPTH